MSIAAMLLPEWDVDMATTRRVYLRLVQVPVPSMYGPTADERF